MLTSLIVAAGALLVGAVASSFGRSPAMATDERSLPRDAARARR